MSEPLFLLELLVAVLFGMVGSVFVTTSRRVIKARGSGVWIAGVTVTVLLFAALWRLDDVTDGPDLRILVLIALTLVGTALGEPLRRRVLGSTAQTDR